MTGNRSPFSSAKGFKKLFWDGLLKRLDSKSDDLGFFLLACSNFFQHHDALGCDLGADEREGMRQKLAQAFSQHYTRLLPAFAAGAVPERTTKDDMHVFRGMAPTGADFDGLQAACCKWVGPWKVVYNQIRALRPRRAAGDQARELDRPLEGFNYNKVKKDESFWCGDLADTKCYLLFNKFPFADYHTVVVPDIELNLNQLLQQRYHVWLWNLLTPLEDVIPEIAVGYNSMGAYASAKHFHFQLFLQDREQPLSVTRDCWEHNRKGGDQAYPTDCQFFDDPDEAWKYIAKCHELVTAYNLLYVPGGVYWFPRRFQSDCKHSEWTTGFAFYELSGAMLTFDQEHYAGLTCEMQIEQELSRVRLVRLFE